jgi:hypothetical protein
MFASVTLTETVILSINRDGYFTMLVSINVLTEAVAVRLPA